VTVTLTVAVTVAVGVPEMIPVAGSSVKVAGRPVAVQVYEGVPPIAAKVAVYGLPAGPDGSDGVVMVTFAAIVRFKAAVAVCAVGVVESLTVMCTRPVLAAAGVPEIAPVVALMLRPCGRSADDHVYDCVPPVAATVALYAVVARPFGRVVVVMLSCGVMTRVSCRVAVKCDGVVPSVTVTDTGDVPAAVGVPEIAPVEESSVKFAGRPLADQEYGPVPPVTARVAEYGLPAGRDGSVSVVIVRPGLIFRDRVFEMLRCVGVVASVAVNVTVAVPVVVGVPVIAPVVVLIASPAGNPDAAQVYDGVPPLAATEPL
jgi:hypothetical protein